MQGSARADPERLEAAQTAEEDVQDVAARRDRLVGRLAAAPVSPAAPSRSEIPPCSIRYAETVPLPVFAVKATRELGVTATQQAACWWFSIAADVAVRAPDPETE